ncbi:MAG: hypothetical protein HY326_08620 [Chloroflexi bacterium]|nr:hypothetical protein [Chloroflexota bacterium]
MEPIWKLPTQAVSNSIPISFWLSKAPAETIVSWLPADLRPGIEIQLPAA